ncbi:DUF6790 family protein [uncultured Methanoregula sp.]|uniref:DUF6790 family protein n=1 Tax=uncultured Methanoregula sp. TaxID=1005933 RepID=UPI002AABF7FA|nr:DUF6790 family protein [uncultured Methanoregula sp.]
MADETVTAREATLLFWATMAVSMAGIFLGIFFSFTSIDLAVRVAAALLVGIVGIISFFRHSVYFRSDQVRMGWHQDHPAFQLEVGYANLAIGIWALVAAVFNGSALACGLVLAIYGTYLLCTLFLHAAEAADTRYKNIPADRQRAVRSVLSTLFFVLFLFGFAFIAFARAGLVPFMHL